MGTLDRDRGALRVFRLATMRLTTSTYHRPLPGLVNRRRVVRLLACLLAGTALWAAPAGAATLLVQGAGNGHGVGMSQDGAYGYAKRGYSYQAILAHYYTGTTIGMAPAKAVVRVLVGTKVVRVPLERYVRGVVSAEMPASWPLAALEAQAAAKRGEGDHPVIAARFARKEASEQLTVAALFDEWIADSSSQPIASCPKTSRSISCAPRTFSAA